MRTLAATDMSVYSTADFEAAYTYEGDDLGAMCAGLLTGVLVYKKKK